MHLLPIILILFNPFCHPNLEPRELADEPLQMGSMCAFEGAGKGYPINAGPAYRLTDGLVGQTIEQWTGCVWYRSTLVVDCDDRKSIRIPNSGNIAGYKNGSFDGDGPPLPYFLTPQQRSSVDDLATVYGDGWRVFEDILASAESGSEPNAYCACSALPDLEDEG